MQSASPRSRGTTIGLITPVIAATGIVFGDIGTSPLYVLQAVFHEHHSAVEVNQTDILGVISMIIWCLLLVVTVTYVSFIMRADNNGEGGILALTSLLIRTIGKRSRLAAVAAVLAAIGTALFFGDSLITPAISMLSAVEGLTVVNPSLESLVVPGALTILLCLFAVQRWGTAKLSAAFGPIMVLWFALLIVMGVPHIINAPIILLALSPFTALQLVVAHPIIGFFAAGAVVLCITGVEALYADMGHFGRPPIARAWLFIVFPALAVNYMGQGAFLLTHPEGVSNPFFRMVPEWATVPLVVLATATTVIASQAVISGTYSLARQASRMSLLPRIAVRHTSEHVGQIYIPVINTLLCVGVLLLVIVFQSSEALVAAYGLSVTGMLLLSLVLFLLLASRVWNWPVWAIALFGASIGTLELLLFGAGITKIFNGAWLPLLIATVLTTVMLTWRRGSTIMFTRRALMEGPLEEFIHKIDQQKIQRVPGTAVYAHGNPETAPLALRENVRFQHVLHENIVIFTVKTLPVPHQPENQRITITDVGDVGDGIVQVTYRVGFHDRPDIPKGLRLAVGAHPKLEINVNNAVYVLSSFQITPGDSHTMPKWQKVLFRALEKFSANQTRVLSLPVDRTIVVGATVKL